MAEKTLTAGQFAEKLGTDGKTARRFLRKQGMGVGQGNRYEIPTSAVRRLSAEYRKWAKAEAEAKAAREAEKAKKAESDTQDEKAESVDSPEADTADEPTETDLQDIEDEPAEDPEPSEEL